MKIIIVGKYGKYFSNFLFYLSFVFHMMHSNPTHFHLPVVF